MDTVSDKRSTNISLSFEVIYHRVKILLDRACVTIEYEETDANFPDQNVQRHSMTSLETARSLANVPKDGG